jgi:hypothetical protein
VRTAILEGFPDTDIRVSIVWIPMLEGDAEAAARGSATDFSDPRVRQFYDAERRLGRHVAEVLGGGPDAVAWDIYLFFGAGSRWTQRLPRPSAWMHQLTTSNWAAAEQYHTSDDLIQELHRTMGELMSKQGGA